MANVQFAFIDRAMVPSRSQWQQAIDDSGFDLHVDDNLKPFEHSGFLPCVFLGKNSGVETYYQPAGDVIADWDELGELSGGKDFCISFRWGGSFQEAACAMILSYALAKSFGAVVSYGGETPYSTLEAFRSDTEEIIKGAQEKVKTCWCMADVV